MFHIIGLLVLIFVCGRLECVLSAAWLRFLLCVPFMSGGDRDESEDAAGDLRRTESDSVLKKVGISAANYS